MQLACERERDEECVSVRAIANATRRVSCEAICVFTDGLCLVLTTVLNGLCALRWMVAEGEAYDAVLGVAFVRISPNRPCYSEEYYH